jgi:hypothetical protein
MTRLEASLRLARRAALAVVALAVAAGASEHADENRLVVEALELGTNMVAADVGAGDKRFTKILARTVGP